MSALPPPEAQALPGPDPREPIPEPVSDPEPEPNGNDIMIVIEEGTAVQNSQPSLVEAATAERKRRATAPKSIAIVTDKNLKDFRDGQLTETGGPQPNVRRSSKPAAADTAEPEVAADPETYWRGRILRARMNWASAVEETDHLESKIAELRQRFYAEEDPYYRDSRIKPSWDRAIDRLEEARAAIDQYRSEVRTILEEGRRASALPGWLREGLDLEPEVLRSRTENRPSPPGEHIPGEPKVAADPDGEPW